MAFLLVGVREVRWDNTACDIICEEKNEKVERRVTLISGWILSHLWYETAALLS